MNSLYAAAPIPSNSSNEDFGDENASRDGLQLSARNSSMCSSSSLSDSCESEEIQEGEESVSPQRVLAQLKKRCHAAARLLERLDHFAAVYGGTKGNLRTCTVSGVGKLRNRMEKERQNAQALLTSLERAMAGTQGNGLSVDTIVTKSILLLRCSGLSHFDLLLDFAERESQVVGIFVSIPPSRSEEGSGKALEVDVVSCGGLRWTKLRTSSSRTLHLESSLPETEASPFVNLLTELQERAEQVRLAFGRVPQVCALFSATPPPPLRQTLEGKSILVSSRASTGAGVWRRPPPVNFCPKLLCFDTTALVALCSDTCFGGKEDPDDSLQHLARYKVLTDQLKKELVDGAVEQHIDAHLRAYTTWLERSEVALLVSASAGGGESGAVPQLMSVDSAWMVELKAAWQVHGTVSGAQSAFVSAMRACDDGAARDDKTPNWIVADVTYHEFKWMIETLAGPMEVWRASQLLPYLSVVDTAFLRHYAPRENSLFACMEDPSGVSLRNRVVFGMADELEAAIITSNRQVQNVVKEQGLHLLALDHPSRSLTEQKLKGLPRRPGSPQPPPFDYFGKTVH